jgi:hypothetical protein
MQACMADRLRREMYCRCRTAVSPGFHTDEYFAMTFARLWISDGPAVTGGRGGEGKGRIFGNLLDLPNIRDSHRWQIASGFPFIQAFLRFCSFVPCWRVSLCTRILCPGFRNLSFPRRIWDIWTRCSRESLARRLRITSPVPPLVCVWVDRVAQ